jgi:phosphoglycolate phosphatase
MVERALAAEGVALDRDTLDAVHDRFLRHYESRIARLSRPYPGAIAVIDRLRAEGVRFAVCTNKLEGLARRLIEELGIVDRFAAITGPDTYGAGKPDPTMLVETIAAMGGVPKRAVMVGDSRYDSEAARNAGVPFIGVSFGYTETPMAELGPDILIDSFAELPAALQRLVASPAQRPKGQSQSQ